MKKYVSHVSVRRVDENGKPFGIIHDFGYIESEEGRGKMVDLRLENDEGVSYCEEMMDFFGRDAKDQEEKIFKTDCGNYNIYCKYFEVN